MKHTAYFILPVSLFFCIVFTISCKQASLKQKQYAAIQNYFSNRQHKNLAPSVKALIVLSEYGCPTCNEMFSKMVENNLHKKDVWFLITALGSEINLSLFNDKQANIFYDQTVTRTKYSNLFHKSEVYFFKNNRVDTTVVISAKNIDKGQLGYINKRLGK